MAFQTIDVKPIAGALGAEVSGADLSQDLGNKAFDEIHQAFLDHHVLFFRDQTLTPQQQAGFSRRFGPLGIYPFVAPLPEAEEVIEILKTEKDSKNFGGAWHSDTSYLETPALATVLYAHEVPDAGGDTMYANMHLAYESLSDGMKELLDGLIGVNSAALTAGGGRAKNMKERKGMNEQNMEMADDLAAEHPVVRTHPDTGRKSLYINGVHTARIKGMTVEESKPLLRYLCAHATRPEFTCRFRWTPGALAIWDNRCTQHYAINDYSGVRRRMHRTTVVGARPN